MSEIEIDRILSEYTCRIESFFHQRVYDEYDADDLVQESLCAVLESYRSFKKNSSASTWIYSICRNTLYNYFYRKNRHNSLISKLKNQRVTREQHEYTFYVEESLERLFKIYSRLYQLYYRDCYKVKEIAGILHKPQGTVKHLLYQLRQRIRESFQLF